MRCLVRSIHYLSIRVVATATTIYLFSLVILFYEILAAIRLDAIV